MSDESVDHNRSLPDTEEAKASLQRVPHFTVMMAFLRFCIFVILDHTKQLFFSFFHKSNRKNHIHNNGSVRQDSKQSKESFEQVPLYSTAIAYLGFHMVMLLGMVNQLLFRPKDKRDNNREGYPPLYGLYEVSYLRYVGWLKDCMYRPICSAPAAEVVFKERVIQDAWTSKFTGEEKKRLNFGSYNYLGFAESTGKCTEDVIRNIREKNGLGLCSPANEYGTTKTAKLLEALTAEFLGVEDAIVFAAGFATNALNIASIVSKGCLVLSDEKNHTSIILGLRLSGAVAKVFKHNDMEHLEKLLREAIVHGQPLTGTPWRKILIFVEGIYSMEGSIVHLPQIIALKKKYKAYLYLDEAHSIAAIGKRGRGVVDYFGLNPRDVDILMGTFSKAFNSMGGYIGGSKALINCIRANSHAATYGSTMSPSVAQQCISSMTIIMGRDGSTEGMRRISQLARNTRYFRKRLHQMGVIIYGNEDSPVIPLLVYQFCKVGVAIRMLADENIALVGAAFPATPLLKVRLRFCLSAAHTKEQLDYALDGINKLADKVGLKHSRKPRDPNPILYEDDPEIRPMTDSKETPE